MNARKVPRLDAFSTFFRNRMDAYESAIVNKTPDPQLTGEACTPMQMNEALERQAANIANALHDDAGQLLTVAYLKLDRARREVPPECALYLDEVRNMLDQIEQQLRRLSYELHPAVLKDSGLNNALEFLIQGVAERSGLKIRLEGTIGLAITASIETVFYRFAQEAITNILRHARARNAVIRLTHTAEEATCTVSDDGVGFDTAHYRQGLGICGMRQRVQAVGGKLSLSSIPGIGSEMTVTIPLRRAAR